MRRNARAAIIGGCLLAAGCSDPQYAMEAVIGQLTLMSRAEPIQLVMDDPTLTEAQRAKIALITGIREYAAHTIGLNVGRSYTTYVDTGGGPVAYNLSASARDAFAPVKWTFPVVGAVPYLGFFDRRRAEEYRERLESLGYDTVLYEVGAYSTLGMFADPITSDMLDDDEAALADLLIHELTHNTVYRVGDTTFSENVAAFVGRVGALQYLRDKYGVDSPQVARALDRYADIDLYNGFIADLYVRLAQLYGSELPSDQKIAARQEIFDHCVERFRTEIQPRMRRPEDFDWVAGMEVNNAWLLLHARYNADYSAFEAAYQAVGADLVAAIKIFRQAAASDDPIAYLWRSAGR